MTWTREQKLLTGLIIAAFALSFTIYITRAHSVNMVEASSGQAAEIGSLRADVAHLKKEITRLESADKALANDLLFRTNPANIDAAQRAWFAELLKRDPDQVRGVDGKLPKER